MCLGALAGNMSIEIYAQENPKNYKDLIEKKFNNNEYNMDENGKITITYLEKEKITDKISMGVLWKGTENNPININLLFNNTVEINDSGIEIENANAFNPIHEDITMQFSENLSIYNKNSYAIYGKSYASGTAGTASIIIGNQDNKKNIVKIIGNIKAESKNGSGKSEIKLNLNNEYSFFAGKMETGENNKDNNNEYNNSIIEMNLKDKATWYAHRSNMDDIYTIDGSNKELRTEITSNGGVIDIYNSAPNEARTESAGTREFTLKGVGDRLQNTTFRISTNIKNKDAVIDIYNSAPNEARTESAGTREFTLKGVGDRLQNTTFRISTNIKNKDADKRADKIILNDVKVNKNSETYYIQIAAVLKHTIFK